MVSFWLESKILTRVEILNLDIHLKSNIYISKLFLYLLDKSLEFNLTNINRVLAVNDSIACNYNCKCLFGYYVDYFDGTSLSLEYYHHNCFYRFIECEIFCSFLSFRITLYYLFIKNFIWYS